MENATSLGLGFFFKGLCTFLQMLHSYLQSMSQNPIIHKIPVFYPLQCSQQNGLLPVLTLGPPRSPENSDLIVEETLSGVFHKLKQGETAHCINQ